MAAKRKLQSEIEICLKKVEEGLEYFHELWDKAHEESNTAQREKLASELKKEIKKLQRHREQVKNWVAKHPDLLNKEPLLEARRKIEKEMERFKNFEKEVKTKTYSKVGLQIKKAKLTPEQKEAMEWLKEQREILKEQLDELDEQLDKIQRKRGKKKNLNQEEALMKRVDKHKWHRLQIKDLSKKIEKGRVLPDQLEVLKDDIIYYVEEAALDEEFYDNDFYEGIEEIEIPESEAEGNEEMIKSPSPIPVKKKKERKKKTKEKKKKPKKEKKKKKAVILKEEPKVVLKPEKAPNFPIAASSSPCITSVSPATTVSVTHSEPTPIILNAISNQTSRYSPQIQSTSHTQIPSSSGIFPPHINQQIASYNNTTQVNNNDLHPQQHQTNTSSHIHSSLSNFSLSNQILSSQVPPQSSINLERQSSGLSHSSQLTPQLKPQQPSIAPSVPPTPPTDQAQSSGSASRIPDFQSIMLEEERRQKKQKLIQKKQREEQVDVESQNVWSAGTPFSVSRNLMNPMESRVLGDRKIGQPIHAQSIMQQLIEPISQQQSRMPNSLSPSSQQKETNMYSNKNNKGDMPSHSTQSPTPIFGSLSDLECKSLNEISSSFRNMPQALPSRSYFPRNPIRVPEVFPLNPHKNCDQPEYVSKYDVDTLFFMFHYTQGTHQQFLAAQELKKRSWRYHKKYLTWFQRHTEPKVANNEFEQGAYIYFDYESSWCQRVKNDFMFEYQYLEDNV